MLDGINGLVVGFMIVALSFLAVFYVYYKVDFSLIFLFLSALIGFLPFNFQFFKKGSAMAFLGDAGSIMLGFMLAWFCLALSDKVSISYLFWILALPLLDMARVTMVRLFSRSNIMKPDRRHLHYLLLEKFSARSTLIIMLFASVVLSSVGVIGWLYKLSDKAMLFGLAAVLIGYYYLVKIIFPCEITCTPCK
jgi:UDP-GlcNAc:undecaprenyl-phosphate GlcNAc-1-phosphate transferase